MSVKPLYILLVDISGYTHFIRMHKISLLHAEGIIGELMESILEKVEPPVVAHEILGDAISLYAEDDGSAGLADHIYQQLENYFIAFRSKEAYLLRECGYCTCEACKKVGQLKLKAILHTGIAAFTKVRDIQKISGEDIITAHRLLKNSIDSREYILATDAFVQRLGPTFETRGFETHREDFPDIGVIAGKVKKLDGVEAVSVKVPRWKKMLFMLKIGYFTFSRLFLGKRGLEFRSLPSSAS